MDNLIHGVIIILLIIVIGLLLMCCGKLTPQSSSSEGYKPCQYCDTYYMPQAGTSVVNPFTWPASGTSCVDDIYKLSLDAGANISPPLTHASTPDHVVLTN